MEYTLSILRDYHLDTGYTTWLSVEFDQSRLVKSNNVRRQVTGIFEAAVGRLPVSEHPFTGYRFTKFWVAGPMSEAEAESLKERKVV